MSLKKYRHLAEAIVEDKAVGDVMVALYRSALFEEVYKELRSRHRELGEQWDEMQWPYKSPFEESRAEATWQKYTELGRLMSYIGERL